MSVCVCVCACVRAFLFCVFGFRVYGSEKPTMSWLTGFGALGLQL